MRSHAKASSAGSTMRQAKGLGRIVRGTLGGCRASGDADGSGAPAGRIFSLYLPLVLLVAALFAAPAQAAPETIAEYGQSAGRVSLPMGVAVDQSTGDFYVAERNNFRVSKFDSEGNFLLAFGYGVADGVTHELQVCGPAASPPTVRCFAPNFYPLFVAPVSVAVDQSTGDVYVGEDANRVFKFTPAGQLVFMIGKNVNKTKEAEASSTQAEKDFCLVSSGDTCGAAESGTGSNEFSSPNLPLAVDSAGVVWVGDGERLASFDAAGVPGAEISPPGAGAVLSLAFDSADNFYVISSALPGVRKLEAGTGAPLKTFDEAGYPRTVTLDEAGNLFVGDCGEAGFFCPSYQFKVYAPTGEQTYQFGAGQVLGRPEGNALEIGESAARLYVASNGSEPAESVVQAFPLPEPGPLVEGGHVEDLLPTTATLISSLNSEGHETTYHFEYGTSESYGQSTPTDSLAAGFDAEPVEAALEELIPATTYHFRLVATNHCNPAEPAEECTAAGPDATFTTLPAVAIDSQWATDIAATSAELHAEMDPLGVEAEAWLEYGTSESYGQLVPLANLGSGFGAIARQVFLKDLSPGTTYHYRFLARDERDGNVYTVPGQDRVFVTQISGLGFELPDGRAWEMVSPADKHGGRLVLFNEAHLQASADGEGLAYQSAGSLEIAPDGNRMLEPSMNLARRSADGTWSSKDISAPNDHAAVVAVTVGTEYKFFSPDLGSGLLEPRGSAPLSPEASERTPYLRTNTEPPSYTPLVTDKEGFANIPPGTGFGGDDEPQLAIGYVRIQGATPALEHVVLRSQVPLGPETVVGGLYEWSGGQFERVSVRPQDEGGDMVSAVLGSGPGSVRKAISDDGSRVFWTASGGHLYLHESGTLQSVRLDRLQPDGTGEGTSNPRFQGASADGTVAFFTDSGQLTQGASPAGSDLYRCEIPPGNAAGGCATLTDISAPAPGSGESAEVLGVAAALNEDASRLYFVAKGVLDEAPNGHGDSAVAGEPNLYLWQEGEGARFVATLAAEDKTDWGGPGGAGELSAAGSPNGRYLAFMSRRSLTGYENGDETSGEPAQEVFRYDALEDSLECVSCNPTGAAPLSVEAPHSDGSLVNPSRSWQGQQVASTLPAAVTIGLSNNTLYRPRSVLDNGRVFFNAIDALVPADSNGEWDVYQYEPDGLGDCSASSNGASTSRSAGGCVSLLSSGTGETEAAFFDAGESGEDAFFITPAALSVTDEDQELDIYDARVDGIPATRTPITECSGEACQPLAQAPNDPTPASAAFKGAGNVHPAARKRCAKGKRSVRRKGQVRCVAKKQQRKGSRRAKQRPGGTKRRANR